MSTLDALEGQFAWSTEWAKWMSLHRRTLPISSLGNFSTLFLGCKEMTPLNGGRLDNFGQLLFME